MKTNPVIPYAIIAIIGILAVIIISAIGIGQRTDIQNADEGGENGGEEVSLTDPEEIYELNCALCHGADLTGGMGPDLTTIGSAFSADELKDIMHNGIGTMPPVQSIADDEAQILADWLSEKQ